MAKNAKKETNLPETVFVQRVNGDGGYLLVYDSVEKIDLDYGPIVGAYEIVNLISVSETPRTVEVI